MIKTAEERFLQKVKKIPDGCWLWQGYITPKGYGRFTEKVKPKVKIIFAHRWSYSFYVGDVPEDLVLDHLCEIKSCVNPKHLEPVTNKENLNRGNVGAKNATRHREKTHCRRGHEYVEENTQYISRGKRDLIFGLTRQCKICYTNRRKKYKKL